MLWIDFNPKSGENHTLERKRPKDLAGLGVSTTTGVEPTFIWMGRCHPFRIPVRANGGESPMNTKS